MLVNNNSCVVKCCSQPRWYKLGLQNRACLNLLIEGWVLRMTSYICVSKVWWFVLIWAGLAVYSKNQNQYYKGRFSKSWLLSCSSNITLSLSSYTVSALSRELNFVTTILVSCIFGCSWMRDKSARQLCLCYGLSPNIKSDFGKIKWYGIDRLSNIWPKYNLLISLKIFKLSAEQTDQKKWRP